MFIFCSLFLDNGHRVTHKSTKQPSVEGYQRGTEHKPTEPYKGYNDSIKHGGILADSLTSRHPTVNQSFIDRIVAEIQAEHPIFGKEKSNNSDNLQQLIDNVADSVVKQVTEEFYGAKHKPSRRVEVPKPPLETGASAPEDSKANMPLLNDHPSETPHVKSAAFLENAIKKLASKDEDLPPEMINSDEISGHMTPHPPPEDVKSSSMMSSEPESNFSSNYAAREKHPLRGPLPENPGKQEIREMFKFKHRLKKKKPMVEKGLKKLTIPATTEGKKVF